VKKKYLTHKMHPAMHSNIVADMQARTKRFFAGAGKYDYRADTVLTVHDSEVMGLLRSYAANDPLTRQQREQIDATASARFKMLSEGREVKLT
jgi:hypothetical protein